MCTRGRGEKAGAGFTVDLLDFLTSSVGAKASKRGNLLSREYGGVRACVCQRRPTPLLDVCTASPVRLRRRRLGDVVGCFGYGDFWLTPRGEVFVQPNRFSIPSESSGITIVLRPTTPSYQRLKESATMFRNPIDAAIGAASKRARVFDPHRCDNHMKEQQD